VRVLQLTQIGSDEAKRIAGRLRCIELRVVLAICTFDIDTVLRRIIVVLFYLFIRLTEDVVRTV
jgi:hypothetical protein